MSAVPALSRASWLAAAKAARNAIPMLMYRASLQASPARRAGLQHEAMLLQRKARTFEAIAANLKE